MKTILAFVGEWIMNHQFYVALVLGTALLLGGCRPSGFVEIERQDDAMAIVWAGVYAEHDDAPPDVEWMFPERLDCDANHGWLKGGDGPCVGGLMHDWEWWAQVAHPYDFTFSNSSFAHELFHAWLYVRTGDSNPSHSNVNFGTEYGHPYGGLVDQASNELYRRGL